MRRSNIVEALLSSGLFKNRHPAVIERLASHGSWTHYGSGSILPAADSWPDFHILLEGSVRVVHYAESGREVRLCEFTDGQVFGGFDLTGDSQIVVHTVARTDSTAIRFAGWTVFDAARADPHLGLDVLRGTAYVVAHLASSLVELTVERARDRVRLELVRQARRNMVDEQGWWRTWMIDYVLCPDGYFYPAETRCPDYDTWGQYAVANYNTLGEHQVTEIKDITVYRAGICPRNLGPFPFQIGIVRHDDVVSHVERSNEIPSERSGYFAADEPMAVLAADVDYGNYRATGSWTTLTLVPGIFKHRTDGNCGATLPIVSRTEFDRIRDDVDRIVWHRYHLLLCNCQHWAERVVDGVDRRPPGCIGHFYH